MALVLVLSAAVMGGFGAVLGAVLAYYLPRLVLHLLWGALAAGGVLAFLQGRAADEFDRIGANITVFAVLLPFLIGSLITGTMVRRKPRPQPD
jgi:hypothetical protein